MAIQLCGSAGDLAGGSAGGVRHTHHAPGVVQELAAVSHRAGGGRAVW